MGVSNVRPDMSFIHQGTEGSFDINKSLTKREERPHQYRRESVVKVCKTVGITTA